MDQDKTDPAQRPQTLLEAAKATMNWWGIGSLPDQLRSLRAAVARAEAKPRDATAKSWEAIADEWMEAHSEQRDRAQQAEAEAKWHREESARLSAELAKVRAKPTEFDAYLNNTRRALRAQPDESCFVAAEAMRRRAERAEADRDEQRARAEAENDRNRALSKMLIAAHGREHAESQRAEKAEAELAKLRDHVAKSLSMPPESTTDDLIDKDRVVLTSIINDLARTGLPLPLKVRDALPQVVDELLRLRAELAEESPPATTPYLPPFEGDPKACAFQKPQQFHPIANAKWVAIAVEIRNNATGVVRDYRTIAILNDGEDAPSDFPWRDGNYGCDCNRALFFAQASGEPDPDVPCGEGSYSVRVRNPLTGLVFYDEFQP